MEGLFYSQKEKLLFWIPSYYTHGTRKLDALIENLKEGESVLRKYTQSEISCDEIQQSRRYKSMWCFCASCDTAPEDAYKLGADWTVWAWIHD